MDEFRDVLEELTFVDMKTDGDWFTWVNNRDDNNMVKERLDKFLISINAINNFPFIATNMVRQANSDHDAVLMDTIGQNLERTSKIRDFSLSSMCVGRKRGFPKTL